jgi:hypothetical protein
MSVEGTRTLTRHDQDTIVAGKAGVLWTQFTENEKGFVRMGVFPAAKMAVAERELKEAGVDPRDVCRLLAVALMDVAQKNGGMRA